MKPAREMSPEEIAAKFEQDLEEIIQEGIRDKKLANIRRQLRKNKRHPNE